MNHRSFAALIAVFLATALLLCSCSEKPADATDSLTGIGRPDPLPDASEDSALPVSDPVPDTVPPDTEDTGPEVMVPEITVPISIYDMTAYAYGYEAYGKVDVLYDDMSLGRDLCCVAVFLSEEPLVDGYDYATIWNGCLDLIETDISGYRTGFRITYVTPEGTVDMPILRPEDIDTGTWDYLEEYIYDDVKGSSVSWYSHLLPEEFDDRTNVTSLKVTAGPEVGNVSDVFVTAFLYAGSDIEKIYADPASVENLNHYTVRIVPNPER